MKRIIGMGLMLATLLALTAGLASAGTATPRVNRRETRQHARIRQGVESGQITPLEAARLREMQWHLRRMELIAKADGIVTPTERLMLLRAQNRQSRHIYWLEHNARTKT